MRNWLFDPDALKSTPSCIDGIDAAAEDRHRREGIRLILDIGGELKLDPHPTLATAGVYFHRFYMFHSFREFPGRLTALSCLFLAGKVEETPKKCKDIVSLAKDKCPNDAAFAGRYLNVIQEEVMTIERVLLQTVKFDLQVEHPYKCLLQYAKIFKIDRELKRNIVQMAWTFLNDSLSTTLCLQWEPEVIAIALIHLAGRLNKTPLTDWNDKMPGSTEQWWDQFVENVSNDIIEDICHTVLDLYSAATRARNAQVMLAIP